MNRVTATHLTSSFVGVDPLEWNFLDGGEKDLDLERLNGELRLRRENGEPPRLNPGERDRDLNRRTGDRR